MNLKRFLAINKWRINFGYTWIGTIGIGLVVCKTIQDISKQYIILPIWILFPLCVFTLWLVGYIVDKNKMYSEEMKYSTERNDFFREMREEINKK